jgi:hypothetical protein
VLGWNAATLQPLPVSQLFNRRKTSPDTFFLSSVWMSGYGIASDDNGSLFLVTGNSDYSGTTYNSTYNLEESVIKLSTDLTTVQSFFTPKGGQNDWRQLDYYDNDFGSGGVLLLPPQNGRTPNLAVAAGKAGPMYRHQGQDAGSLSELWLLVRPILFCRWRRRWPGGRKHRQQRDRLEGQDVAQGCAGL